MHFKLLNPSKYLQATDFEAPDWKFGREPTLTIRQVVLERMEGEKKGEEKTKGMILTAEQPKGWVMNVTNAKCMAAMWGDETNNWVGKRITLCSEKVYAFGEWVPGIRVKGSPELSEPKSVLIKLRKKTETINLVRTGSAAPANGTNGTNGKSVEHVADGKVHFGPKNGTEIIHLTPLELTDSIALAKKNIKEAAPGARWIPKTQANLAELDAELQRRLKIEEQMKAGPPPGGGELAPLPEDLDAPF